MENEDNQNVNSGYSTGTTYNMRKNRGILSALDPMHRSLLNQNLLLEEQLSSETNSNCELVTSVVDTEDDDLEYFSSNSSIFSDNSADSDATPTEQSDAHDLEQNNYALLELNKNCCKENIWSTQSTSPSLYQSAVESNYLSPALSQSDSIYFNYFETNSENAQAAKLKPTIIDATKSKRIECNSNKTQNPLSRVRNSDEDDDGSSCSNYTETELTSSEYSETNLLMDNIKNRENEMFRKISYNNGYYATSGSDANSISECSKCSAHRFGKKRRSLPTMNAPSYATSLNSPKVSNLIVSKMKPKQMNQQRKNSYKNDRNSSNGICNQKITITIRAKNSNDFGSLPVNTNLNQKTSNEDENQFDDELITNANPKPNYSDIQSDCEESTTYLSIKSDSKYNSEQSQYFDCIDDSDNCSKHSISSAYSKFSKLNSQSANLKKNCEKMQTKEKFHATKKNSNEMICIFQEMKSDRTITSHVTVDREKVKKFRKQKMQRKIIDNSFSEEIFAETSNLSNVDVIDENEKNIVDNKPQKIKLKNKFMSSDFAPIKINNSPRSTAKSIGRLLNAKREITNIRCLMIEKVAADIMIADEKYAQRLKKSEELPPIKPPRIFIASSSSSPQSKQSVDSTATIPIEDIGYNKHAMGFVIPPSAPPAPLLSKKNYYDERMHIGWVHGEQSNKNTFENRQEKQETDNGILPKENIDTVDCSTSARQEFEDFSANLDEHNRQNLSTPIKGVRSRSCENNRQTSKEPLKESKEVKCEKCHGTLKRKSSKFLSTKNGKKIGKAALKRTKTIISSSKQLLKKKSKNEKSDKCRCCCCCNHRSEANDQNPKPYDVDETVRMNSETFCSHGKEKRVNKSLNLTPKLMNTAQSIALNPSPERIARRLDDKKLKTENIDSSGTYATPMASFNFNRIIDSPSQNNTKIDSGKASPSKLIMKLNQIAKNSKTLFRGGKPSTSAAARSLGDVESKHYYRSYAGIEVDNKIPLMGETLQNLRSKLESEYEEYPKIKISSARKSLFRGRSLSTLASGDLLDESITEQIADIQIHDEPEPLYAEVKQYNLPKSDIDEVDSIVKSAPTKIQEVLIENSRYLMVNDDPKILYATVNRRKNSISSYESSFNMSSIGEFAQSFQEMIDEHQAKLQRVYNNDEESHVACEEANTSKSLSDDFSSGCSSFYQRNRVMAETGEHKRWQDFMDSLSFCTVKTSNYGDSTSTANGIRNAVESMDANLSMNQSDEDSFGSKEEKNRYEELLNEPNINSQEGDSFLRSKDQSDYLTSESKNASNISTNASPKTSKNASPNYKYLKNKLRNSIRKSKGYFKRADVGNMSHDESQNADPSRNMCSSICNYPKAHDEPIYKTIHSELQLALAQENLCSDTLQLIQIDNRVCHQQNVRRELNDALEICRTSKEFRNSSELIESERLMLVSILKEFAAKEELTRLWHLNENYKQSLNTSHATLSVVYLELMLREDAIYETHFNYYYVCVLSYRDKVECSVPKERKGNRVIFNDLKFQFNQLPSNFDVRVEIFVLRLRKNQKFSDEKKNVQIPNVSSSSRFRFHGRTILRSADLTINKHKQYPAQRNLRKESNDSFVFAMYDIIDGELDLYGGDLNNLKREALIGFQIEIEFPSGADCSGFLNVAQKKWKWDRLWCRIDGFKMNFWPYPQEYSGVAPILTLDLQKCPNDRNVMPITRDECAKSRSFKLEFIEDKDTISAYYIAVDSQVDLENWLQKINAILKIMRDWKI